MSRVHILASGTPTPTAERFGSSSVIDVGGELVMIDCGPAATDKLVKAGLLPTRVNHLFFTHHHFDHDVDYPCFLLTRWDQGAGREAKLKVFGPPPTAVITERIIGEEGAFAHDWRARVNSPGSQRIFVNRGGTLPRKPPSVDVTEIAAGFVYDGGSWQMTAALAQHAQPWLDCLAYRIDADQSVVFTGDTAPCPSVVELARGADAMFCMCWDDQERMSTTQETRGSCGTTGAAQMAHDAGVKKLVLMHMGPHISSGGPLEKGLRDIRGVFDGEVIVSRELMTVEI